MARIRTIKPEFFTSEDIFGMTPLARLFYVSLWCESDRAGRLEWKPGTFKARYLPADNCDINALGDELIAKGLIDVYEVDGKKYAFIPTFAEHQVINNREAQSVIPPRVLTRESGVSTRESGEKAEGKEGREGKEGKGTSPGNPPDAPNPPDERPVTEKPTRRHGSEDDHKAARWMFEQVQIVNATAKAPKFDAWADEVRLMREIDRRPHADMCALFLWAKRDAFWCSNIQSPAKLREKWDQLTEQRARGPKRGGQSGPQEGKFTFAGTDRAADHAAQAASMARHNIVIPEGEVEF